VIHEVDGAVRAMVRAEAVGGSDVEVVLDAPTKDWAARRNAPTVNLYLYDIREDLRRRELGWVEEHGPDGNVTSRRPAPRWFKLSYLVTAWTQRPEDEHRLLSSLLRCFLRHDCLPAEHVVGALAETGLVVPLTIGLPPPEDRGFADVWSALGGELKPSLDVVVVAPIESGVVYTTAPPPVEGAYLDLSELGEGADDRVARDTGRHLRRTSESSVVSEVSGAPAAAAVSTPAAAPPRARRRGRQT
jgi:hypothetical protein